MKVYALVGKSGTGKSFQAVNLCKELSIDSIVDDGLFIFESQIMAGVSAKRQSTKVGAVKTALFFKDEHRDEVAIAIKKVKPKKLLLLGTSDEMVRRIGKRLGLSPIEKVIYIDDITTESERAIAHKQRSEMGKHVIPVPTFQLKRQFSGYFMDPMRMLRGWGTGKGVHGEKSVVRPTYSYLGDYVISDKVIYDIIHRVAMDLKGFDSIQRVLVETGFEGIELTVLATMNYGGPLIEQAKALQKKGAEQVEFMTAFNINKIDVEIRGLK
ncbi:MAG: hypothetical protein RSA73_07695 [Anaerovoracaceae bacterium]